MKSKSKKLVAVGLRYDQTQEAAPSISVKGEALRAEEVVKIAERFGVPVIHDDQLAAALQSLDPESEIPEDLFEAVALILHELEISNKS